MDSEMQSPLDDDYAPEHIAPKAMERIKADCVRFQELYGHLIVAENLRRRSEGSVESSAGHDFWLTRAGHGAGFWDGDWDKGVGEILTRASKSFGEVDLYVGDDGRIHCDGGTLQPEPVEGAAPVPAMRP
jgi:hypothetical protein